MRRIIIQAVSYLVSGTVGGIVGICNAYFNGKINNNYNLGTIKKLSVNANGSVGGIIGVIMSNAQGEIKYNYNIGEIRTVGNNQEDIGGVIGSIDGASVTRSNNYYLVGISNVTFNSIEGEEKDSEYMKSAEFLSKLNEEQSPAVWEFRTGENNAYPVLIKTTE